MKKFLFYFTAAAVLCCVPAVEAQKGRKPAAKPAAVASQEKPVTVTLVRWPYT